jgi:hypothetical protein
MGTVTTTAEVNASVICTGKSCRNLTNRPNNPALRGPVDNVWATCCQHVDTAAFSGDSAVDNLVGVVDNRL